MAANLQRSSGQPQSSLMRRLMQRGIYCSSVLLAQWFLSVSSFDRNVAGNSWGRRRVGRPKRRVAQIHVLLAIIACMMAGCAPRIGANPELVRKYEDWLKAQLSVSQRAVGTPKSPQDVVFVTDLRGTPERGLSKVYL